MKVITKYVADDGAEFMNPDNAVKRDALFSRCRALEAMLFPHPDDSGERVHQPRLAEFKAGVVAVCGELFPSEESFQHPPAEIHPFSFAGRFLSDCAPQCLYALWHRLMCCDPAGYEYQQPYYAYDPATRFVPTVKR